MGFNPIVCSFHGVLLPHLNFLSIDFLVSSLCWNAFSLIIACSQRNRNATTSQIEKIVQNRKQEDDRLVTWRMTTEILYFGMYQVAPFASSITITKVVRKSSAKLYLVVLYTSIMFFFPAHSNYHPILSDASKVAVSMIMY